MGLHELLSQWAESIEQLDEADDAVGAIEAAIEGPLRRGPFLYRKAGTDPLLRQLIIPFKSAGCVALFEINADSTIDVLAVRHQLESDCYQS